MERILALSTGTKLILASGFLLFLDLFLTWQTVPQRFGKKFELTESLDGWDRLGLVLGLLTVGLLALVVIRQTDADLSPGVPWNQITLVLAALVLALALLKSSTDANSAWAAYVGVALGVLLVVGAVLDRDRPEPEPKPIDTGNWKPRVRVRADAAPTTGPQPHTASAEPDGAPGETATRW